MCTVRIAIQHNDLARYIYFRNLCRIQSAGIEQNKKFHCQVPTSNSTITYAAGTEAVGRF